MRERIITIPLPAVFPGAGAALGNNYAYTALPFPITVISVVAAPSANDANLTLDVNVAAATKIAALVCDDQDVPGTWKSTAVGGTETPFTVAANALISFDANDAAHATMIVGHILATVAEN